MLIQGLDRDVWSPINGWLADDESFFSLCSRIHFSVGFRRSSDTCRLLFGHPAHGLQHDFPARLSSFVTVTGGHFGSAAQVLGHTLFPFFFAWMQVKSAEQALVQVCNERSSYAWRFRLRTATCGVSPDHPLKACPACVETDLLQTGVPYWRVHHQYPGVWVCKVHGCLLSVQLRQISRAGALSFCLPSIEEMTFVDVVRSEELAAIGRFSEFCVASVRHLALRSAASQIWRIGRALEEFKPIDSPRRRKQLESAARSYVAYLATLRQAPGVPVLAADKYAAMAWLWKVKYGAWHRLHPLVLLSIAHWLFGEWREDACPADASSVR